MMYIKIQAIHLFDPCHSVNVHTTVRNLHKDKHETKYEYK